MVSELDQKIDEINKRIQKERKFLGASLALRQATANQEVLRQNDAKIRETEISLAYFEQTLHELQARKAQEDLARSGGSTHSPAPSTRGNRSSEYDRALPQIPSGGHDPRYGPRSPEMRYSQPDAGPPKPKLSSFDLTKADTPLTTAKISKMLHQLEFKYQVERQYKTGIDKMSKLYQADGDKKSRADAESKKIESERKIQLLQTSLKRYKNLHILDEAADDEPAGPDTDGERKDNLRAKPLSGILQVTVKGARDLDHAPIVSSRSRSAAKQGNETHVALKVEGTQLARSHPSRTDRWNEDFEITVDKANEVEIAVYDRQIGQPHALPIGLLWIRISDLVDALRRQKVVNESGQGGWVTAGAMYGDAPGGPAPHGPGGGGSDDPLNFTHRGAASGPGGYTDGIDAWFSVEPAGAIALHLNFIKENVRKRPPDAPLGGGLGRQGAVRKRKDEVHEMNGHKFVQKQFYQLMLCAFCNEFLLNALGYQCEDCRYTCHKKCYEKVVTKCISKSNTGTDGDEEKINHRIPHRFEPLTNIGANWCCHCGYMLPLGRKNSRKCSECDITCHANCAHLVPDFCGMTMETANELLRNWRDINRARGGKASISGRTGYQPSHAPTSSQTSMDGQLGSGMERLRLEAPEHPPQATPQEMYRPPPQQPPVSQPQYPSQPALPPPQGRVPPPSAKPPPAYSQEYSPRPEARVPPPTASPQMHPTKLQQAPSPAPQQQRPPPAKQVHKRKVGLDDFNFLAVLGKGNFGKVMLAEEKKTNGLYAIKVLKKEFIIDNDEVESTRSEKRVFLAAARERHPFLLGLHSCFQTETRIYFVMEYVSGGDLMLHIQRKQFSLRQAKFYASEVLLALEYFHSQGIIYRDLKLDNILLTLDGHVKVADYGLCKEEMWYGQTTSTFCGTPEFMAPEILLEQRYGRAVDWWAFGVLTYEMLLGQSPFRGDDEDEIFDAILEDEPLYPITMPRDAVSILQKLLTRDPSRRLGSGKDDAEEIKRQPFFKDVNWDDVFHKRIPPPYFPTINGSADTSNFDEEFTREQPTLTPVHGQLSSRDQAEFNGFSWVAPWAEA